MSMRKFQIFNIKSHKDLKKHDVLFSAEGTEGECKVVIPCTKKRKPNVIMRFEGKEYTIPVVTFDLLVRFGLNRIKREVNP